MIKTAISAARAAGKILRESFGKEVKVNENPAHDIKIQADIDTQNLIYDMILKAYPDHKLIGEEGDSGSDNGEVEWIVDPIDGTLNFAMGLPHFCVSIAARRKGEMILGVIYDPMRDELFTVEKGKPTLLNGKEVKVSPRTQLKDAILAVGFSKTAETFEHALKLFDYYGHNAKKLRSMGSAALDLAYVSCGRLDAYIEQGVNIWDVAAGKLMVEQAGGKFVMKEKKGGKLKILASNGKIDFPMQ